MAGARAYHGPARPSAASAAFDALRRTIKDSDIAFNKLLTESFDNERTPPSFVDPRVNITTDSSSCSPDTPEIKIDKFVPSVIKKKFKHQKPKSKFKKRVELYILQDKENSNNLKSHDFIFDKICEDNTNTSQTINECFDDRNRSLVKKLNDDTMYLPNVSFKHGKTYESKNTLNKHSNLLKVFGNVLPACSTPCKKLLYDQYRKPDPGSDTINPDDIISPIKSDNRKNITFENIVDLSNVNNSYNELLPDLEKSNQIINLDESNNLNRYSLDLFQSTKDSLENNDPIIRENLVSPLEDLKNAIVPDICLNKTNSILEISQDLTDEKVELYPHDKIEISNRSEAINSKHDLIERNNGSLNEDESNMNSSLELNKISHITADNSVDINYLDYSVRIPSPDLVENLHSASDVKINETNALNNACLDSMDQNYRMRSLSGLFVNNRNRSNKYSIINHQNINKESTILEVSENTLETTPIDHVEIEKKVSIHEISETDVRSCESGSESTLKNDSIDSSIDSNSISSLKSHIIESEMKQLKSADIKNFKRTTNILPQRRSVRLENFRLSKIKENELATLPDDNSAEDVNESVEIPQYRPSIILKPGKKWERSLSILRQANAFNVTSNTTLSDCFNHTVGRLNQPRGRKYQTMVDDVINLQNPKDLSCTINNAVLSRKSNVRFIQESCLELSGVDGSTIHEKTVYNEIFSVNCDDTKVNFSRLSISEYNRSTALIDEIDPGDLPHWKDLSARDVVLRRCNQTYFLPFDDCYPERKLRNCRKIGEGVYGEVFLYKNELDPANPIVMKIIPIEGTTLINLEHQKKFNEILSEIVIAMELSDLRKNDYNKTFAFNKVNQVRCVQGRYPERLLELWDLYDAVKGSENECPSIFDDNQLYIVLELANGGDDLEAFTFVDAAQSYALFFQVVHALAVAEEAFQFEHRDLHWGNILVTQTDDQNVAYIHRGTEYSIPTHGVSATLIDYTFSRMSIPQVACTIFNDLSTDDDLFTATGDYQFEIYRLMRKKNGNNWQRYEPYTNILWMDYVLGKMIKGLHYDNSKSKVHTVYVNKLKKIKNKILNYNSCSDFVANEEF